MADNPAGRTLISVPKALGNIIRERAKANYRPIGNEAAMLIERGLAAEKAVASSNTVYAQMKREEQLRG